MVGSEETFSPGFVATPLSSKYVGIDKVLYRARGLTAVTLQMKALANFGTETIIEPQVPMDLSQP